MKEHAEADDGDRTNDSRLICSNRIIQEVSVKEVEYNGIMHVTSA